MSDAFDIVLGPGSATATAMNLLPTSTSAVVDPGFPRQGVPTPKRRISNILFDPI